MSGDHNMHQKDMPVVKDTGGPAFPTDDVCYNGMTLRDYFAAKASEEDINQHIWKGHKEDFVQLDGYGKKTILQREAMWSREEAKYRYADAMLKARDQ